MNQIDQDRENDSAEDPLDPKAQATMDRVRRRAAISMGVMMIGFMAVVLVVVYRLVTMGSAPEAAISLDAITLPAGAQVLSGALADGMLTITYSVEGATAIRVFDGADGRLLRDIAVTTGE